MDQNKLYKSHYKQLFDSIPEYWDEIYTEDTFYGYHYQRRRELIAELLCSTGPQPGQVILDVGCGAGGYFPDYLDAGLEVKGVDASDSMSEKVRNIFSKEIGEGKVSVETGDIENLCFEDNVFDYAVSAGVFMYLPDMKQALAEMHRVVKVGGYAILNIDNHRTIASMSDIPKLLHNVLLKISGKFGKTNANKSCETESGEPAPLTKSYSPAALRRMASDMGLEILDEVGHGFGPVRLFGKRIFPEKMDLALYKMTEGLYKNKYIGRTGFTYTLLVKKV